MQINSNHFIEDDSLLECFVRMSIRYVPISRRSCVCLISWRWRQYVPLKFWYLSTRPHVITSPPYS